MDTSKKKAESVRPIYKKLLVAAIAVYVIGSCILQVDLCKRIGYLEHVLMHH